MSRFLAGSESFFADRLCVHIYLIYYLLANAGDMPNKLFQGQFFHFKLAYTYARRLLLVFSFLLT